MYHVDYQPLLPRVGVPYAPLKSLRINDFQRLLFIRLARMYSKECKQWITFYWFVRYL